MAAPLQVDLISPVPPGADGGGNLVLQRHLLATDALRCVYRGGSPAERTAAAPAWIRRLQNTRLSRYCEAYWAWRDGRWLDPRLPRQTGADLVVTVAHGDTCSAALRYAKRHRLPAVVFFHDWWPDIARVPARWHGTVARRFQEWYRQADVALCVSAQMKTALGSHPASKVLRPIPGTTAHAHAAEMPAPAGRPLRVLYAGNLIEYAAMLRDAMEATHEFPDISLVVRGNHPTWPDEFRARAQAEGRWLPGCPREEFDRWLASADAYLIAMAFDPALRRRMETSFPSKLIEFSQYGKPLIVWGPAYCSAVQWAQTTRQAQVVTSPDARELWRAVAAMAGSTERQRLAAAALTLATTEFSPQALQEEFETILREAVARPREHTALYR